MEENKMMNRRDFFKVSSMGMLTLVLSGCGLNALGGSSRGQSAAANSGSSAAATGSVDAGKKVLVLYFSWSGNTRKIAEKIHHASAGGDIFEIRSAVPYPKEYDDAVKQAHQELADNARPALAEKLPNISAYDVIFLGYPVWSHHVPRIIMTTLGSTSFDSKVVAPFCTSVRSDISETLPEIKETFLKAVWQEGLTAKDEDQVEPWLKQLGLK